jgi:hypothetical protein
MNKRTYIHGTSPREQQRLIDQARAMKPRQSSPG